MNVYKRSGIVLNNRLGPLSEGIYLYHQQERLMVKARLNTAHITYKLTEGELSIDYKRHQNE